MAKEKDKKGPETSEKLQQNTQEEDKKDDETAKIVEISTVTAVAAGAETITPLELEVHKLIANNQQLFDESDIEQVEKRLKQGISYTAELLAAHESTPKLSEAAQKRAKTLRAQLDEAFVTEITSFYEDLLAALDEIMARIHDNGFSALLQDGKLQANESYIELLIAIADLMVDGNTQVTRELSTLSPEYARRYEITSKDYQGRKRALIGELAQKTRGKSNDNLEELADSILEVRDIKKLYESLEQHAEDPDRKELLLHRIKRNLEHMQNSIAGQLKVPLQTVEMFEDFEQPEAMDLMVLTTNKYLRVGLIVKKLQKLLRD